MNSRVVFTLILGIFWFLYPPKAYAECSKCKGKVEWLRAQREKEGEESSEVKDWDTGKTNWDNKASSDQPLKVKKKPSDNK